MSEDLITLLNYLKVVMFVFQSIVCFFCLRDCIIAVGPLAQSAERGADNAKIVSSILTRNTTIYLLVACFLIALLQKKKKKL